MAKITTSPEERIVLRVEQRKSFALSISIADARGKPVDLTDAVLVLTWLNNRAKLAHPEQVAPSDITTVEAESVVPSSGYATFDVQAEDLDLLAGSYPYTVTLRSRDGYSVVLAKGELSLQPNSEMASVSYIYDSAGPRSGLDVLLQDRQVLQVSVGGVVPPGKDWITDRERQVLDTIQVVDGGVVVDLTGYVTTQALQDALQPYVTETDLTSTLSDYVLQAALVTTLSDYVTSSSLASTLSDYVTSSSLAATLSDYVTSSSLASTLSSYVTSSTLASTLTGYSQTGHKHPWSDITSPPNFITQDSGGNATIAGIFRASDVRAEAGSGMARMVVSQSTGGGGVYLNDPSFSGTSMYIRANGGKMEIYNSNAGTDGFAFSGGAFASFANRIDANGYLVANSRLQHTGATDTGSAANVFMSSVGVIYRSTSSARSKVSIEPVHTMPELLLEIEPRDWHDKGAAERYANYLEGQEDADGAELGVPFRRIPGLVAEELEAAGLDQFVTYEPDPDNEGQVRTAGVMYDRLWTLLIPLVREQRQQIAELQQRLNVIENGAGQ